ncbi:hypothetical protein [Citrobacter koseri]|uniref:hypothetical protein n=1 Tax=Citrobacter koseri TaxID=545 RepID=UPI003891DD53
MMPNPIISILVIYKFDKTTDVSNPIYIVFNHSESHVIGDFSSLEQAQVKLKEINVSCTQQKNMVYDIIFDGNIITDIEPTQPSNEKEKTGNELKDNAKKFMINYLNNKLIPLIEESTPVENNSIATKKKPGSRR